MSYKPYILIALSIIRTSWWRYACPKSGIENQYLLIIHQPFMVSWFNFQEYIFNKFYHYLSHEIIRGLCIGEVESGGHSILNLPNSVIWHDLFVKLCWNIPHMTFYKKLGYSEDRSCKSEITRVFPRVVSRVKKFLNFSITWHVQATILFGHNIRILHYPTMYGMVLSNVWLLRTRTPKMSCLLTHFWSLVYLNKLPTSSFFKYILFVSQGLSS